MDLLGRGEVVGMRVVVVLDVLIRHDAGGHDVADVAVEERRLARRFDRRDDFRLLVESGLERFLKHQTLADVVLEEARLCRRSGRSSSSSAC